MNYFLDTDHKKDVIIEANVSQYQYKKLFDESSSTVCFTNEEDGKIYLKVSCSDIEYIVLHNVSAESVNVKVYNTSNSIIFEASKNTEKSVQLYVGCGEETVETFVDDVIYFETGELSAEYFEIEITTGSFGYVGALDFGVATFLGALEWGYTISGNMLSLQKKDNFNLLNVYSKNESVNVNYTNFKNGNYEDVSAIYFRNKLSYMMNLKYERSEFSINGNNVISSGYMPKKFTFIDKASKIIGLYSVDGFSLTGKNYVVNSCNVKLKSYDSRDNIIIDKDDGYQFVKLDPSTDQPTLDIENTQGCIANKLHLNDVEAESKIVITMKPYYSDSSILRVYFDTTKDIVLDFEFKSFLKQKNFYNYEIGIKSLKIGTVLYGRDLIEQTFGEYTKETIARNLIVENDKTVFIEMEVSNRGNIYELSMLQKNFYVGQNEDYKILERVKLDRFYSEDFIKYENYDEQSDYVNILDGFVMEIGEVSSPFEIREIVSYVELFHDTDPSYPKTSIYETSYSANISTLDIIYRVLVPYKGDIFIRDDNEFYAPASITTETIDTRDTLDIFGDGSCVELYKFENSAYGESGTYFSGDITYEDMVFGKGANGLDNSNFSIDFTNGGTITFFIKISSDESDYASVMDAAGVDVTIRVDRVEIGDNSKSYDSFLNDDQIHFVSILINDSARAYVYIDGNYIYSNDVNLNTSYDLDFYGKTTVTIDQLRVFNRELSMEEISMIESEQVVFEKYDMSGTGLSKIDGVYYDKIKTYETNGTEKDYFEKLKYTLDGTSLKLQTKVKNALWQKTHLGIEGNSEAHLTNLEVIYFGKKDE